MQEVIGISGGPGVGGVALQLGPLSVWIGLRSSRSRLVVGDEEREPVWAAPQTPQEEFEAERAARARRAVL